MGGHTSHTIGLSVHPTIVGCKYKSSVASKSLCEIRQDNSHVPTVTTIHSVLSGLEVSQMGSEVGIF